MNISRALVVIWILSMLPVASTLAQEVRVFPGYEQSIAWMESIGWWGEDLRSEQI
jgi:hypothetical protein